MGNRRINQNKRRTCWGKILQRSICVKAPTKAFRETASFVRTPESRDKAWKLHQNQKINNSFYIHKPHPTLHAPRHRNYQNCCFIFQTDLYKTVNYFSEFC